MEKEEEEEEKKLKWMYKGISGIVDREQYLTGRKIDKTFEILEREEAAVKGDFVVENENDFTRTLLEKQQQQFRTATTVPGNSCVTVDLGAKLREDPLYEIKRKQAEERKKLIENPMKMKRIKRLLESALNEDSSSSSSGSDSGSSSESDNHSDDTRRIRRKKNAGQRTRKRSHSDNERIASEERIDRHSQSKSRKYSREHRQPEREYSEKRSYRDERRHSSSRRERERERTTRKSTSKSSNNYRNEDRDDHDRHHRAHRHHHHSEKSDDSNYSNRNDHGKRSQGRKSHETSHSGPQKHSSSRTKFTEEELERRRQEMLENANWRDEQRKRAISAYKKEEENEKKTNELPTSQSSNSASLSSAGAEIFIKPLINIAMETESLEKRIKQKIFTSQRNSRTMEKNFVRK